MSALAGLSGFSLGVVATLPGGYMGNFYWLKLRMVLAWDSCEENEVKIVGCVAN